MIVSTTSEYFVLVWRNVFMEVGVIKDVRRTKACEEVDYLKRGVCEERE